MATEYVIYTRYQNRVGVGRLPDIQTRYLAELPPIVELTADIREALVFDKEEAKELAYMVYMDYKPKY